MSSDFITIIHQLPENLKYQIVKVYRTCLKAKFFRIFNVYTMNAVS